MDKVKELEKKIQHLSPDLISHLESYIDFLLQKNRVGAKKKLKQNWAGGLKTLKKKYTSIELQKKALEWRGE